MNENQKRLQQRTLKAAGEALYKKDYVSAIDVLIGMQWLTPSDVEDWRKGKIPYLEKVIQANLNKITQCMKYFRAWAVSNEMKPSLTVYHMRKSKKDLRFSISGNYNIEKEYRTHYVSPKLLAIKKQRLQKELEDKLQEKTLQEAQKENVDTSSRSTDASSSSSTHLADGLTTPATDSPLPF